MVLYMRTAESRTITPRLPSTLPRTTEAVTLYRSPWDRSLGKLAVKPSTTTVDTPDVYVS